MIKYTKEVAPLEAIVTDLRSIRARTCEPKADTKPRYLALSDGASNVNKAIQNVNADA